LKNGSKNCTHAAHLEILLIAFTRYFKSQQLSVYWQLLHSKTLSKKNVAEPGRTKNFRVFARKLPEIINNFS
jgi:hypothetical protein